MALYAHLLVFGSLFVSLVVLVALAAVTSLDKFLSR